MLNLVFIRKNQDFFERIFKKRKIDVNLIELFDIFDKKNNLLSTIEGLKASKNKIVEEIAKKAKEKLDITDLKNQTIAINNEVVELEAKFNEVEAELSKKMSVIPNILLDEVPFGGNEDANVEIRKYLEPKKFSFKVKPHYEFDDIDIKRGVKLSGSRFCITKNKVAKLERALVNFMLNYLEEKGFSEHNLPFLVSGETAYGSGQLPKFEEDLFKTNCGKYLIPTAEVPLVNIYSNEILEEKNLPIRMCAHTYCFRSEAGSGGRDTIGLIRQHQFQKVEMVSIVKPEESETEHQKLLSIAEDMLKMLEIPYRVMLLCSGDTGFHSAKTYDIEAWIPSQEKYREIASCSNVLEFQSRRNMMRFNDENKNKIYPHTLNSSALPIGRTLIAILENHQQEDGTIIIPSILRKYTGFDIL